MTADQPDWTRSVLVGLAGFTAIGVANLKGKTITVPGNTTGATFVARTNAQLLTVWVWGITVGTATRYFHLSVDGTPSAFSADALGAGERASNRVAGLKCFGFGVSGVAGATYTTTTLFAVYSVTP